MLQLACRHESSIAFGRRARESIAVHPMKRGLEDEFGREPVIETDGRFAVYEERGFGGVCHAVERGSQAIELTGHLPALGDPKSRLEVETSRRQIAW